MPLLSILTGEGEPLDACDMNLAIFRFSNVLVLFLSILVFTNVENCSRKIASATCTSEYFSKGLSCKPTKFTHFPCHVKICSMLDSGFVCPSRSFLYLCS